MEWSGADSRLADWKTAQAGGFHYGCAGHDVRSVVPGSPAGARFSADANLVHRDESELLPTTATLIVGLQGLPGAATLLPRDQIWTAIALAIYLALIGAVIQAYRPRGDAPALNPREFLQYPAEDPTFTKQQLLITMMIVHEENITTEVAKRRWLERAQWLLITEAVYLIGVAITRSQWENVSGIVEALTG